MAALLVPILDLILAAGVAPDRPESAITFSRAVATIEYTTDRLSAHPPGSVHRSPEASPEASHSAGRAMWYGWIARRLAEDVDSRTTDHFVPFAVEYADGSAACAWCDTDFNGDLTDDPPLKLWSYPGVEGTRSFLAELRWLSRLDGREALVERTLRAVLEPRATAEEDGPLCRVQIVHAMMGEVILEERPHRAFLFDGNGDGFYTHDQLDGLFVDLDDDGHIVVDQMLPEFGSFDVPCAMGRTSYEVTTVNPEGRMIELREIGPAEAPQPPPTLGRPAPGFSYVDSDGRTRRLSDLRGGYALVYFWASSCCAGRGPALRERGSMPHLTEPAPSREVTMTKRTPFPRVFWIANGIEVLERFAYYGIYFGFGIYMASLGYSRSQLGIVQSIFLLISYGIPVVSGTFADRFGFKKVLIVSYLAYLPSILLLIVTRSFSGIALTMLSIGLAAGIFKPLIAGTVRATTDKTNKSLGFGIFYQMVNVGGSFGPMLMGNLRAISWNAAFIAAAVCILLMLLITILFYKEPEREIESATLGQRFKDIGVVLMDFKFTTFLILLGIFFWLPFWCFFNLCALYVDSNLDTAGLYASMRTVMGPLAGFFSAKGEDGVTRVLGETISHTGLVIMIFQFMVSRIFERWRAIPSFFFGMLVLIAGFVVIGYAKISAPAIVFAGIVLFAVGEMIASPRIQEYITWIAPKEKAGLYMGMNFLATMIGGALSGVTFTSLYGVFNDSGHPEYIWFTLAAHTLVGLILLMIFTRTLGEFTEQEK